MIKRKTSKELLAESMEQLAAESSVNKIRIADITSNCGLSSPMFYYYYKDADDIINYIFQMQFEQRMENEPEKMDYRWMLEQMAEMIEEKMDFYLNVLQNTGGINSLYNVSAQIVLEHIRSRISPEFPDGKIPVNLDMMLEFYILGIRTRACDMIITGCTDDKEDIINIFIDALPLDLRPYMMNE